jgi:hypothetical protein
VHLLDVNVLIALVDSGHPFHSQAKEWLGARLETGWATCPLTENALLRILGAPSYPRSPGGPSDVRRLLDQLRRVRGFEFWPDEVSFADTSLFSSLSGVTAKQLTDIYLVGLAVRRSGRFVTFDNRVSSRAVSGGDQAIEIISTAI